MKKLLKRIVYAILILFVLLNVMAAFHAYRFTKFYDRKKGEASFNAKEAGLADKLQAIVFGVKSYRKRIDSLPAAFDTVHITTSDGLQLEGWQAPSFSDTLPGRGTIILFHGHGGNKAGMPNEADAFRQLGFSVLLVDFRAHGNSEGNVCTIGYDEAKDVMAAYRYIQSLNERNIILWGVSLGAASVMKAVSDSSIQQSAKIIEMPFGRLHEAVKARCRIMGVPQEPISTLLTFWGGVERGFWAFDHNPETYAAKIKCPVLLQWGSTDERVSREETNAIFNNIASGNKAFVEYTVSGHQSLCTNEHDKWITTVNGFLDKHILKRR